MSTETLYAEAALGRDAMDFLQSEIGRYLVGRCKQEIEDAQEKLAQVSSWRRRRIQQLQNEIWRAKAMQSWIAELVLQGREAEAQLDALEHE